MYSRCLRCRRSLGRNADIAYLPIGRRIAFDVPNGRLWVVCRACGQWNLAPIEERWEALAECDALAASAETRVGTAGIGIARTTSGVELLRIGGVSAEELASWRFGHRLVRRLSVFRGIGAMLAAGALAFGAALGFSVHSFAAGGYAALALGLWLSVIWLDPPHLLPLRLVAAQGGVVLWPWQLHRLEIERHEPRPVVMLQQGDESSPVRWEGLAAARMLATVLPRLNWSTYSMTSIRDALDSLAAAEAETAAAAQPLGEATSSSSESIRATLRPWERIAADAVVDTVLDSAPQYRLALEMAVTEEVERAELATVSRAARLEWREQEAIAAIADDLLVPEQIAARLRRARESRQATD